jgi:phosphotransferase system enzyme I (PtsI)
MSVLKGISAACGYAEGLAMVKKPLKPVVRRYSVTDAEAEVRRFKAAQNIYAERMSRLSSLTGRTLGLEASGIFEAYGLIVRDEEFLIKVFVRVRRELCNIEAVLYDECARIWEVLGRAEDAYMRERARDIENVTTAILNIMSGEDDGFWRAADSAGGLVVVAESLAPEEMQRLDKSCLRGVVTELGGTTSHTVILARALDIPAVVGVFGALRLIRDGDFLQLDAFRGTVSVNPDAAAKADFADRNRIYAEERLIKHSSIAVLQ